MALGVGPQLIGAETRAVNAVVGNMGDNRASRVPQAPVKALSILSKLLGKRTRAVDVPAEPEEAPENRTTARPNTYRVASVTYPSGYVRKGVVVDISETGARLRFSQRGGLPERVTLKIEGRAGALEADVVWQEDSDAGVHFVS